VREQNPQNEVVSSEPSFIIKKVKKGHGGHHGGTWKVAYADFITTMMALFIVLWIVGQSQEVRESVGQYFRDPGAFNKYTKRDIFTDSVPMQLGTSRLNQREGSEEEKQALEQIGKALQTAFLTIPEFARLKDQIVVKVTNEGLLIELLEKEDSSFFELGNASLNRSAIAVLQEVCKAIRTLPNPILIAGHTDSRPYSSPSSYSNWELSTDRANSARRLMEDFGIPPERIIQLRGHADRKLRYPEQPYDVRNRRISILILYDANEPIVESANEPPEGK